MDPPGPCCGFGPASVTTGPAGRAPGPRGPLVTLTRLAMRAGGKCSRFNCALEENAACAEGSSRVSGVNVYSTARAHSHKSENSRMNRGNFFAGHAPCRIHASVGDVRKKLSRARRHSSRDASPKSADRERHRRLLNVHEQCAPIGPDASAGELARTTLHVRERRIERDRPFRPGEPDAHLVTTSRRESVRPPASSRAKYSPAGTACPAPSVRSQAIAYAPGSRSPLARMRVVRPAAS